jgi:dihydroorotate dehydrogenase (NAD+) catalytic subunit
VTATELRGHKHASGPEDVDVRTALGSVEIPSPVLTASGCSAFGRELEPFLDVAALGAVVTKSVQLRPRSGRPTPRMAETPSGMLNSIGLQGPGIDGVAASDVIAAVRTAADPGQPVYAKLSPDVTDIVSVARACVDAGADGLSMINTLLGLVIDPDTMRPVLGGVTGGLSGPAIRPVALRCVWQVHAALPRVPILGMGGIRTGLDALQFVLAGASAVSVGTVVFNDPSAPARIADELAAALAARGFATLTEAVGHAHREGA